jgi:hypothetical protein
LLSPLSPQNLPRKKKRKLMPNQLLPQLRQQRLPNQLLPQLRQQRLPKVSLLRKSQLKQTPKPLLRPRSDLDEGDGFIVDDEVTVGRNLKAREFGKIVHEDVVLSDYVKFRLWLARQLALKKYQETWG